MVNVGLAVREGEEPLRGLRWILVVVLGGLLTLNAAGGCDLDAFCIAFTVAYIGEN